MTITTRLYTAIFGKRVGTDQFGNVYYIERSARKGHKARRWVLYKGKAEPSKIPAEWHGWMHYTLAAPLQQNGKKRFSWEKPHLPNLTGTINAYVPPGHLTRGGHRAPSTSDYESWKP